MFTYILCIVQNTQIDRQFNTLCMYLLKTRSHKRNALIVYKQPHTNPPIVYTHIYIYMFVRMLFHIKQLYHPVSPTNTRSIIFRKFHHMVMCECAYSFV